MSETRLLPPLETAAAIAENCFSDDETATYLWSAFPNAVMACFGCRFFNFLAVPEDETIFSSLTPIMTKAAAHSHRPGNSIRNFRCAVGGVANILLEY